MNPIRRLFLESAVASAELLARDEVRNRWDEPSALEQFSIRGLAGHLVRATGSVEAYLARAEPVGQAPISAAQYYATAVDTPDIHSELHVAVRAKGEAEAAEGYDALLERLRQMTDRLEHRLAVEPDGRLVEVFKGLVLTLDDYLVTRLIEQLVHMDDLAVSVDVDTPPPPPGAMDVVLGALVDIARWRHGDLAVLRSLARRERDAVQALRVL
jgi:hypothetical protein